MQQTHTVQRSGHLTREDLRTLQRLGDVSLFMAGFFAQGFARRLVDIDYHIAMGGRAYGTLADSCRTGARGRALGGVFTELAHKFQRLVDALNDVSEMAHRHDHRDVLRQYEIWLKTGSPRAHGILRSLGPTGRHCRQGALPTEAAGVARGVRAACGALRRACRARCATT
jgi:hypothetical protein